MNKKVVEIVERIKQIDENELDTTNPNNMIDYLMAKTCKKDEENIDFETIEYLEYLRRKIQHSPYPDRVSSIKEILIANEKATSLNKFHAMQMQSNDFLKKYDEILERINKITRILFEKEKLDEKNQKEER